MSAADSLRASIDAHRRLREAIAATVADINAERSRAALDNLQPIPPDSTGERTK